MTVRAHDSIIRRMMIGSRIAASLTTLFVIRKVAFAHETEDARSGSALRPSKNMIIYSTRGGDFV